MLKKQKELKTEQITFDEFIDCITNHRGEEIKQENQSKTEIQKK